MASTRRATTGFNVSVVLTAAAGHYLKELVSGKLTLENNYTLSTYAREPRQVSQIILNLLVHSSPLGESDVSLSTDLEE